MELLVKSQKAGYTYTRKSEYTGLTQREKKNAYVRKYYSGNGKKYHAIRARSKRYDMKKEDFEGCVSVDDVDHRVIEVLKTRGYTDNVVKQLTACLFRKRKITEQ